MKTSIFLTPAMVNNYLGSTEPPIDMPTDHGEPTVEELGRLLVQGNQDRLELRKILKGKTVGTGRKGGK